MSSIKIKDLPEKIDNVQDEDLLVIEDAEDTKKITIVRLKSAFSMDGILISMKEMLLKKINDFMEAHSTRYAELEERNKQLEDTCNSLENNRIHDAERILTLEDRLLSQVETISDLKKSNADLMKAMSTLENEKNELSEMIETANRELNNNKNDFTELSSQYENLQNNYNTLKEENDSLKEIVTALENRSNNDIDNFIKDKNNELASKIEDLMKYIRYYHPDVDSLEV